MKFLNDIMYHRHTPGLSLQGQNDKSFLQDYIQYSEKALDFQNNVEAERFNQLSQLKCNFRHLKLKI